MADSLDDWTRALSGALQLDPDEVNREAILDLAKDAAHRVARPAAPLTAYLVGLAVGRSGGDPAAFARAAAVAEELTAGWQVPVETGSD
jgi:hypothetical protein